MQDLDDLTLLREYAARDSETAFAELVARRVGFVYSAALRQVRDPHLAEEITQAVFIILAQKAGRISDKTILCGWLFKTTRYAAIAQTRDAVKRSLRTATIEKEFQMQSEIQSTAPDALWEQMSPLLDEALATLGETDRQAVLLRFFENKSLAEVGNYLGAGEDTARKRVTRALEKLRKFFSKRGVSSTTAIIAGTISANSVQAAPVALAKSVTAVAIAKGAAASGSTLTLIKGALKIMAWTKAKTIIVVSAVVLLAAGTTTVTINKIQEHRADDSWRIQSNFDSRILDQASPQVRIVATKFPHFGEFGWSSGENKIMGLGAPLQYVVQASWNYGSYRTIFPENLPQDRYDFIASLPSGNQEALRQEIEKQFGLVGHIKAVETNVLLLQVKIPNAPGLTPSTKQSGGMQVWHGTFKCDGEPISILSGILESTFGIPVVDHTNLKGNYDINIRWQENNLANLKQVLLNQLGLQLVPTNMPIEMLVVEKSN